MSDTKTFDPSRYLSKVGKADYLEVKWRLVWLREVHPDALVETELVTHDPERTFAMFKAIVTVPGGGRGTGYGSETARDFGDYIEKAETKAIGRALATLGFGTQFSAFEFGGEGDADRPVDSPVGHSNGKVPARAKSTSVNTIPADDWTAFWADLKARNIDGATYEAVVGKKAPSFGSTQAALDALREAESAIAAEATS